eukprot:m.9639 g.9639  ORF g.9639 m.9639 type:complete len:296 (+) comp4103_c0_seq1:241-1128(+)
MGQRKSKFVQFANPRDYFTVGDDLGSGSYGKVKQVTSKSDGSDCAAKVAKIESKGELMNFSNEINILASIDHKNVTKFVSAYYYDEQLWIVIEKCDGGSLADVMSKIDSSFNEQQIRTASNQMLHALNFLHNMNIYHRDVNAANTLLASDGNVKLADFGVSTQSTKKRTTFIGSPMWMAPEVIKCENKGAESYGPKCDVWSFGITVIEMAERKPPNHDLHPMKAMLKIATGGAPKLKEPEKWGNQLPEFLGVILVKDAESRKTAAMLLEHEFVVGQDDQACLLDLYQALVQTRGS